MSLETSGYRLNDYWLRSSSGQRANVCSVAQSCPTVCDPMDHSPPGSPVRGFPRQEHWSGLPFPSPSASSFFLTKGITHESPALAVGFFTAKPPEKPYQSQGVLLYKTFNPQNKHLREILLSLHF